VNLQILAIGVIVLVAILGACFKAASFRGKLLGDWRRRVSAAEAGLAEKAISELKILNFEIGNRLVSWAKTTDPEKALADPALLLDNARKFLRIMKAKIRIQRNFRILLWTAPVFFWMLVTLVPCIVVVFTTWAGLLNQTQLYDWTKYIGMVALVILLLTFVCYVYLQHALCKDEVLDMDNRDK
jgi:hypothetical protein